MSQNRILNLRNFVTNLCTILLRIVNLNSAFQVMKLDHCIFILALFFMDVVILVFIIVYLSDFCVYFCVDLYNKYTNRESYN